MNSPGVVKSEVKRKAVWGRRALAVALTVLFAGAIPVAAQGKAQGPAAFAAAQKKGPKAPRLTPGGKPFHIKMDDELNKKADGIGDSDVIVMFNDDSDGATRIRNSGGAAGRKLGIIKGRSARMSNMLLRRLADDPKVARIVLDREAKGEIARTTATIGAKNVQQQYGYTGAGIGVAVIDSGISSWHDDLTVANRTGQRVAAFVDFVNGKTAKYDDWGHGTHVAGIIAGNGYDSNGERTAVAPKATIVALKALDADGRGKISNIIAALDWAVSNRVQYNIRVINMSLGAGVFESYNTDPLTLAAKRAVDAGIVVVAAAGNMGKAADGKPQYGAIQSPGNAPWVLTVGASSTMGTTDRRDDTMASYSSRGPTMYDYGAKPDLVAPGSGTVSLSVPNSTFYTTKAAYLVAGKVKGLSYLPYLTLSGTSMAAPVVSGTVALMLQANPNLTPNMVKAILQFTAQVYNGYDFLTQGAGFLNTLGAVRLSRYFAVGHKGDEYPNMKAWSKHIFWGNRRVRGGVLTPGGTAWAGDVQWGANRTPTGQNIVWGENCADASCDNVVWGNNIVWGATDANDNIVWGNDCGGADCDNIVWGNVDEADNIVWGNAEGIDNIVWGNATSADNIVWGNSNGADNVTWGNSAGDGDNYGDDTAEIQSFDPSVWEDLFDIPLFTATPTSSGGVQ